MTPGHCIFFNSRTLSNNATEESNCFKWNTLQVCKNENKSMLKYTEVIIMKGFITDKFRTLPYTDLIIRQDMFLNLLSKQGREFHSKKQQYESVHT